MLLCYAFETAKIIVDLLGYITILGTIFILKKKKIVVVVCYYAWHFVFQLSK